MDIVDQSDALVFVLNSADFNQASSWACEITHPREQPRFALVHLARKYVFTGQRCVSDEAAGLQVPEADWRLEWRELMADAKMQGKQVDVWLYPTREEAARPDLLRERLETVGLQLRMQAAEGHLVLRSLGRDRRWSGMTYADAIHPSAAGVDLLSRIMVSPSAETLMP